MKRLPFALVALSLSIPVVACLNSSDDDDLSQGANDLSEETKAACNFGFTAVAKPADAPIAFGPKSDLVKGKRLAFGNFDKDAKIDFVVATDLSTIQSYTGNGDGTFKAGVKKNIAAIGTNRQRVALSTIAVGDFDGDKVQDVILAATSIAKGADPATAPQQVDYRVLFGKADGSFAYNNQSNLPASTEKIAFAVAGDIDGNGADDLVLVTAKGQSAFFGEPGARDLTPGAITYANTSDRLLAYITPKTDKAPAALVMITADKMAALTFDGKRNATPTEAAITGYDPTALPVAGDLDQNGTTELSMLASKLSILTLGDPGAPLTFDAVSGRAVTALDVDKNGKSELIYTVADESKLYAACGYEPGAKALAAVELPVAYGSGVFLAGTPDLNGDGKPDFVTLPSAGGDLKVYLGGTRVAPAPTLTVLSATGTAAPDAGGVDSSTGPTHDSGPVLGDASAHADADATVLHHDDAGVDSGTTITPADAGHDSGTTAPVDAGTKADSGTTAPHPKGDAGSKPDQGGDGDDGETTPPDDEESGPVKGGKAKPTTKTSSSGSVTISPKPQPQSVDDGCSAAPTHSNGVSTSAIGGLLAAMLLLGRRRNRNNK